ncbi:MAG: hypothetical protein ACRDST_14195, partial [Pseudonocardiaceae bacterium]
GIAVHEGRQWGLINQILVTIAVLAILLSVATSMVMWRKRRPKGIGAPPREPHRKLGLGLLIIIAVLGILFPLLGATILLVLSPRPGSQPMERPSGDSSARAIYGEVSWEQVIPGRDAQRAQRRSGARLREEAPGGHRRAVTQGRRWVGRATIRGSARLTRSRTPVKTPVQRQRGSRVRGTGSCTAAGRC